MNGHTNLRFNTASIAKAMKVAPTTRAIRAALAVSATVLALAGSGTALAGDCSVIELNTVSCNGDFDYTLPDFVPTFDLTLIVGDSAPTTVTPASGDEGILADWDGDVTVISYADITTEAADGVRLVSPFYSASFSNYGSVTTDASDASGDVNASAIDVYAEFGDATVNNHGSILADASVDYGTASAYGAITVGVYGYASLYNDGYGDISANAYAYEGTALAVGSVTQDYVALTVNYGDISADAFAYAGYADSRGSLTEGYAAFTVNGGSISADSAVIYGAALADGAYTIAVYAGLYNYGDISADAFAYEGYADSRGSLTEGYAAFTVNGGSISADSAVIYGDAVAQGAYTNAVFTGLLNYGDISASAYAYYGYAQAAGALTFGYDAFSYNDGSISADAAAVYGAAAATGIVNFAESYSILETGGNGDISASAYAYMGDATATGAEVVAGFFAGVTNAGAISATAYAGGDYGYAEATGLSAIGPYVNVDLASSSEISASAEGEFAYATGVLAAGTESVGFTSASGGLIDASASGYYAYATGVVVAGFNDVYVDNGGDINAFASGVYGSATGMAVYAVYDLAVENSGAISAGFEGYYGYSTGVAMFSIGGDVYLHNSGDISASGGYSTGTYLASKYHATLVNDGTITADTAVWTGASADDIWNYGTITGSIQTNAGDDFLYNADGAVWNALGASYFGAGDDVILNYGTINMSDAAIYLGTYSEYGNHFVNYGVVTASGDNLIDMGGGLDYVEELVPSLNPNPFYNYGTIDFQDGHPDDTLTIVGDFAGDGDINVDVSAIHGTSDLLYIDGSVVDGTSAINPDVIDTPTSQFTEVPMVYVTGDSGASNFALGSVGMDLVHTFLTFDFSLISDVDATNATDDVYSLGIDVTGLSDPGTLAASVVPGVQSLANAQVGTWRQRMGVINKFEDSAFSMWIRWFQNDGTINPDHTASNFGQGGNFNFDQKNTGVEAGADFAVNENFSFGVMAAQSDGKQDLKSPGTGSTKINADTYGVYGTWISNGWYVDGSYRWMDFTAKTKSVAGAYQVDGDANIFNIEVGYAWTLDSGLQIEPQLQYTQTDVSNVDAITVGQTTLQAEDGNSQVTRLGVAFRKSFGDAADGTLWSPYATLSSVWESDGKNDYSINGSDFLGRTSIDGNSALVEVGLTAQTGNWFVYGGINWQDGGALDGFFGGQIGVRYTFGHAAPPPPPPAPAAPAKTCADLDDDGDGVNNCNDKCPGSVAGQAIGPDGCPVPLTIDLKGVNFDFDKATLRPDAVAILDEAISILSKYPELKVEVAGHTDSVGTEVYNQGLSERRAGTVYDYLASHGIGSDRMVGPIGYGETKPIAPNTNPDGSDNPEGRALNRRTELNVQN